MRLLFQHKRNVALDHVRNLFTLLFVQKFFIVGHTPFNIDNKILSLHDESFAATVDTIFEMRSAFALAYGTHRLRLHLHESHIDLLHDDALPVTLGALFSFAAFSPRPATLMTIDISIYGELLHCAVVKLLQSYPNLHLTRRTFLTVVPTSVLLKDNRI